MKNSLVSIVLTLYNKEKFIHEQLESILNQTYTCWELIIVNDCSTDNSLGIVELFKSNHPELNITIVNNPANLKLIKTFERGLILANGDFIAVCDADDVWHSQKIEEQVGYLNHNPAVDLCYHDLFPCDENMKLIGESYLQENAAYRGMDIDNFESLIEINHITAPTIVFRAKWSTYLKKMSEKCHAQDWWIVLVILGNGGKVGFYKKSLIYYRRYGASLSGQESKTRIQIIKEFFNPEKRRILFDNTNKRWHEQKEWLKDILSLVSIQDNKDVIINKINRIDRLIGSFDGRFSKLYSIIFFGIRLRFREFLSLIYFFDR